MFVHRRPSFTGHSARAHRVSSWESDVVPLVNALVARHVAATGSINWEPVLVPKNFGDYVVKKVVAVSSKPQPKVVDVDAVQARRLLRRFAEVDRVIASLLFVLDRLCRRQRACRVNYLLPLGVLRFEVREPALTSLPPPCARVVVHADSPNQKIAWPERDPQVPPGAGQGTTPGVLPPGSTTDPLPSSPPNASLSSLPLPCLTVTADGNTIIIFGAILPTLIFCDAIHGGQRYVPALVET